MRYGRSLKNTLFNCLVTVISLAIALIPFWIWLAFYKFLDPVDFWQRAVVFGFGVYFLGGLQLFFIYIWVRFVIDAVWKN